MVYSEILSFAYETFRSNKVRFALTALGMVIGTASLILVVTIGMTGKQYVLNQIQSIGTNQIEAEYQSGAQRVANVTPDPLTIDDLKAALQQVPGIVAASPVVSLGERIPVGGGKERDISVLGVFPDYKIVRNLVVITGRFFDGKDEQEHNKVGVITQKMAEELYGSQEEAIGKIIKLSGLPFTIVGTFRERVDTFGQTEVVDYTMLIPYTVSRYFTDTPTVKQIYFSASDPAMVAPATDQIRRVIQSRHRAESVYNVHESHATGGAGGEDGQRPDPGAAAGGGGGPAGQRDRDHEHHAGDGELPHPRDRYPQSLGGDQPGDSLPVPVRGHDHLFGRRADRRGDRTGDSLFGTLPDRISNSDFWTVGDCRNSGFVVRGRDLWDGAGDEGGEAGSGGEFEVRVEASALSFGFLVKIHAPAKIWSY